MERSRREEQAAFESLTPEQQDFCLKAGQIMQKYEDKAVEWENQPLEVRQQSPFYEENMIHSDITKHSFLFGVLATEEDKKICYEAASIMIRARNKLFPGREEIHH